MSQAIDVIDEQETTTVLEQPVDVNVPRAVPVDVLTHSRRSVPRWLWITAALVVAVVAALGWWLYGRHFESTDDAQIEGHINVVSGRINGTVVYVNPNVENNQYVEAGTLLVELDPNDYQASLQHARADLATREASAQSAHINVPITNATAFSALRLAEAAREEAIAAVDADQASLVAAQHKVQQDEAIFIRADRDRVRYERLVDSGVVSRQEIDARQAEAWADGQTLEADRAAVVAAERRVAQARSLVAQREAQVEASRTAPQQVNDAQAKSRSSIGQVELAKADVRTAELNLGYTKIYAPVSGIIGRKTVELGHRIQPGQALLAIVPVDDTWVTAYFKETQLKMMRPGQPVTVHVDTFGRDYAATIENLPAAAGTLFSLLPPENASGNFVKVVQRFPVRIRINRDQDPEHRLRPGMSVEPEVRVR